MAKYSHAFKMKTVSEVINEGYSIRHISKKYNIKENTISKWVNKYKTRGVAGLHRNKSKKIYDYELKMRAVARYLESDLSYAEVAQEFNVSNPALICQWVTNVRNSGKDSLRPKKRGRRPVVTEKNKCFKQVQSTNDNIYEEYQALKEELEKCKIELNNLRIDNEILKALRRQRLAEEAKRNAKH